MFCKKNTPKMLTKMSVELQQKVELYKQLSKDQLDVYGWLGNDSDHSMEFTGLYYAATQLEGNPFVLNQDINGMFCRHPSQVDKSLEELNIRTTISIDMFTGLIWHLWINKDLNILNDVLRYAHKHYLIMGKYVTTEHPSTAKKIKEFLQQKVSIICDQKLDKISNWLSKYEGITRVLMSFGLYCTYRGVKAALQQKRFNFWPYIPTYWAKNQTGFRANLEALHIGIRGELKGYVTKKELEVLQDLSDRHPSNALFQALYHKYYDGDQSKVIEILMREDLFPSNRLPTSKDRKTYWLWSSPETDKDWLPDFEYDCTHPGVDLLFAYMLIDT